MGTNLYIDDNSGICIEDELQNYRIAIINFKKSNPQYQKEYYKRNKGKIKGYYNKIKHGELYKRRRRANSKLNYAVRNKIIMKPSKCTLCDRQGIRINGHHENYNKPLDVIWCCTRCHIKMHKN